MKISEPTIVEQERASPRSFSAWSLGYACLILMALVSRDVAAQTIVNVMLQPGESTKTVQAPGVATFTVRYGGHGHFCNWPTTAQIKTRIESHASAGTLQSVLEALEADFGLTDKLNYLMGEGNTQSPHYPFFRADLVVTLQQLAAGPLTHTFRTRCLAVDESQPAFTEIARVIRAYLGIPQGTMLGAPAPQMQQGPANPQMQQGPANPQIQRQMPN